MIQPNLWSLESSNAFSCMARLVAMAARSELPRSSASWHSVINDKMGRDAQVIHTVTECASPSLCR